MANGVDIRKETYVSYALIDLYRTVATPIGEMFGVVPFLFGCFRIVDLIADDILTVRRFRLITMIVDAQLCAERPECEQVELSHSKVVFVWMQRVDFYLFRIFTLF